MTLTLTRFLREQLNKLVEAYGIPGTAGNITPAGMPFEITFVSLKQI